MRGGGGGGGLGEMDKKRRDKTTDKERDVAGGRAGGAHQNVEDTDAQKEADENQQVGAWS